MVHEKIKVIHASSVYEDSSKDALLKTSPSTGETDFWATGQHKITNQHLTFDLGQKCIVTKISLTFGWYSNIKSSKYAPKDFEIQILKQNDSGLPIDSKSDEKWKTVENFKNLKTQQDLGSPEKFAEFKFVNGPIKTRFVRLFIKNNIGASYYIVIGRVKFD